MIRYSRAFIRAPLRVTPNATSLPLLRRYNNTKAQPDADTPVETKPIEPAPVETEPVEPAPVESKVEDKQSISEKDQREKELAEMIAREEIAAAKAKQLRMWQQESIELISTLNKTPSALLEQRLQKLQENLEKLPKKKVKQLDQELEEFMMSKLILPTGEAARRPWIKQESTEGDSNGISDAQVTTQTTQASGFAHVKATPEYKPFSEQELYIRQLHHARVSGKLGSYVTNPNKKSPRRNDPTLENLMAAGCHLGHSTASWRPSTQPYIYGKYKGVHIIDLNKTIPMLKRACDVIEGISRKGGIILYVGTMKNDFLKRQIENLAYETKAYYVTKRWIPGMITNHSEVIKQISAPSKMTVDMGDKAIFAKHHESPQVLKPDLVVLLNPVDNRNCVKECIATNIPTIGLCDTDMEPSLLTYPIPANDDGVRSVSLMLKIFSKAAEEGRKARLEAFDVYKEALEEFHKREKLPEQQGTEQRRVEHNQAPQLE
ncbi:uncharacterized protein J8A68_004394 [[Candida] subhashii]|uniref:Uncharacterized protein n=1 Tax=[Candida] subhashii TaxID=561895 RepID=A0A8J5UKQ0_9ASCO|nr:uncharacterized protein J8A68_004394 [[Candida] subhashii]KAG7662132.1 hypothetical protein J8A68_004394 [[Candida] subhashii]